MATMMMMKMVMNIMMMKIEVITTNQYVKNEDDVYCYNDDDEIMKSLLYFHNN